MQFSNELFHEYQSNIDGISQPENFSSPFNYSPHPLALIAVKETQDYLLNQTSWEHDFGITTKTDLSIGKMFGILVVENQKKEIGYLRAFSGKIANSNHHKGFVPPVFDMLKEDGFYRIGEEELNTINHKIKQIEADPGFSKIHANLKEITKLAREEIRVSKEAIKKAKAIRTEKRTLAQNQLAKNEFLIVENELANEGQNEKVIHKNLIEKWNKEIKAIESKITFPLQAIATLKQERKTKSNELQNKLFTNYTFLNAKKESRNILTIFHDFSNIKPPAGAGECAAPKLFQYAFMNNLKPIALAEFWWGTSPSKEKRLHKEFYPACIEKCKPILSYMLE